MVAEERKYLGNTQAASLESTRETIDYGIQNNIPRYIAVEGENVVGWCEIFPNNLEGFRHSGKLESMGVYPGFRGKGVGGHLLAATLSAAEGFGLERVELLVYASNLNAIEFYIQTGFVIEGTKKRARWLDGEYDDVYIMAVFLNPDRLRY